ncbi:MAG: hypothetical protein QOE28_1050 [Solirubrobacteraceae bacterium]|nr:hypothetical protein [Solirubrobacteraceae bacterium]
MYRWLTLGVRLPEPGASPTEARRFVRDMQLRMLLVAIPLLLVIVVEHLPSWLLAGCALSTLVLAGDAIWLTVVIRRDRDG